MSTLLNKGLWKCELRSRSFDFYAHSKSSTAIIWF